MRFSRFRVTSCLLFLSLFALGADGGGGCDCNLCDDFQGTVRKQQLVQSNSNTISTIVQVDPNENDDVKNNRSKIRNGNVSKIVLQVVSLGGSNRATTIRGEIQVRPVGSGDNGWITIVSDWSEVPLLTGNQYTLRLDQTQVQAFNQLVFSADAGALELRIEGETDNSPVEFMFEIAVELEFQGCV